MSALQISRRDDGQILVAEIDEEGSAPGLPFVLNADDVARILEAQAHADARHVVPAFLEFLTGGRSKIQRLWGMATGVKALVDQEAVAQAARGGDVTHAMQQAMATAHADVAEGILAAREAFNARDPFEITPGA